MNREDGSVLIFSLIILTVLLIFIGSLSASIINESRMTRYEENSFQAQYYAESAIEFSSANMDNEDVWQTVVGSTIMKANYKNEINGAFNASNVIQYVQRTDDDDNNTIEFRTQAKYNDIFKDITAVFEKDVDIRNLNMFDIPVGAGETLQPNGPIKVDGPTASNGVTNNKDKIKDSDGSEKDEDEIYTNLSDDSTGSEDDGLELEMDILMEYLTEAKNNSNAIRIPGIDLNNYNNGSGIVISIPPDLTDIDDITDIIYEEGNDIVIDINDKIVVLDGNITFDNDLYIRGSGILIGKGNIDVKGSLYGNYCTNNNEYTEHYAITYFEKTEVGYSGNVLVKNGKYKGMIMGENDFDSNSSASDNFEVVGSAYAGQNMNPKYNRFSKDSGYADILADIALRYNFETVSITINLIDWRES